MDADPWVVVLVRAWSDDGRLRVRLLRSGSDGLTDAVYAATSAEAAAQLARWLEQAVGAPDGEATTSTGG